MAKHHLPAFKIDKENPEKGIRELMLIIKPSWDQNIISIERLSGGYSGGIFCCFEQNKRDKLTVRVQNVVDADSEWKDAIELKAIQHLSLLGHFPTVHAIFANGYCYQYTEGKAVFNVKENTGSLDDEILLAIAKEMAFIHSIKLPNTAYENSGYFKKMVAMIERLEPKVENALTKKKLLEEYKFLEEYILAQNASLTLCHDDCHPGNYIWDNLKKKLTFVDWEYAHIGYRYQDVAFFVEIINSHGPKKPDRQSSISPAMKMISVTADAEKKFMKWYFEAWCELNNEIHTEKAFYDFVDSIHKFKMVPLLRWATISIFFPDEVEDSAGSENMCHSTSIDGYFKLKNEILRSNICGT